MATLTLDLPGLSASALRGTQFSADKVSMADSLPEVNFGFEELRTRMAKFTVRFDAFIERERKRVLDERNQFRMNVAELRGKVSRVQSSLRKANPAAEDQRHRKRDIEIAQLKSQTHAHTIAKESAETADMHAAISNLTTHRDEMLAHRDELRTELSSLQSTLSARRDAQTRHARYLHSQSRWNGPELQFWEDYLCLRIEGVGKEDRLKFVFSHVCEKDWEREAWFELDTSDREYKILRTSPKIERDEAATCLEKLNESRELGPFFKTMREIFVKTFK
jgi:kinetochore protein Spc25